jgi:hypothetical protein
MVCTCVATLPPSNGGAIANCDVNPQPDAGFGPFGYATCIEVSASADEIQYLSNNATSTDIAFVFAWGCAAVLTLFTIGYAVGVIKRLVNLA